MYRILILVSAFLIALSGLLFLQGGDRDPRDFAADPDGVSEIDLTGVQSLSAPSAQSVSSGDLDLSSLSAAVRATVAPQPVAPQPVAENPELAALTNDVLSELGVRTVQPEADAMRDITAAVLVSLNGSAPAVAPSGPADLRTLIAQSMQAGQGDAYIDALLNEAVSTGQVQVPEAMMTSDGRLDTRTLIASIVTQSMGDADGPDLVALRSEAGGGAVTRAPETTNVAGQRFYTVEAGDSLAYISLLFYKDTSQYSRIYEANRDTIASPNQIRVGQKLLIPG